MSAANASPERGAGIIPDQDAIAEVIEEGRLRQLSSPEIAQQVIDTLDPTFAKLLSHPMRAAAMKIVRRDGRASPSDVGRELGLTSSAMAYHFGVLVRAGAIELCDTAQRRGATEHYYRLANG